MNARLKTRTHLNAFHLFNDFELDFEAFEFYETFELFETIYCETFYETFLWNNYEILIVKQVKSCTGYMKTSLTQTTEISKILKISKINFVSLTQTTEISKIKFCWLPTYSLLRLHSFVGLVSFDLISLDWSVALHLDS